MRLINIILAVLIIIMFIFSRYYIYKNPPYDSKKGGYSDAKHDYERYANMWYYGLPPYLKHYYEYPPATIPLLLVPLILDQHKIGIYYSNFRIQILILDILLFLLIFLTLNKLKIKLKAKLFSLIFYIIATALTRAYLLEEIDLPFIFALIIAIVIPLFFSKENYIIKILFWSFFWLTTAIKFLTFPLLVPFFYLRKKSFKKEIFFLILGFFSIWGIPLLIFRSSLSVSFVFHLQRSMKYSSFPYFIAETINRFTNTEQKFWTPPDMPLIGPVSTAVKQTFDFLFPISIIFFILWSVLSFNKKWHKKYFIKILQNIFLFKTIKLSKEIIFQLMVKISLVFIFLIMITGKILSAPFHIWYIPLITLYPFRNLKKQFIFMLIAIFSLIISTTGWLDIHKDIIIIKPFTLTFFMTCLRFAPIFIMFFLSMRLSIDKNIKVNG